MPKTLEEEALAYIDFLLGDYAGSQVPIIMMDLKESVENLLQQFSQISEIKEGLVLLFNRLVDQADPFHFYFAANGMGTPSSIGAPSATSISDLSLSPIRRPSSHRKGGTQQSFKPEPELQIVLADEAIVSSLCTYIKKRSRYHLNGATYCNRQLEQHLVDMFMRFLRLAGGEVDIALYKTTLKNASKAWWKDNEKNYLAKVHPEAMVSKENEPPGARLKAGLMSERGSAARRKKQQRPVRVSTVDCRCGF
jgi:hypothetical protein